MSAYKTGSQPSTTATPERRLAVSTFTHARDTFPRQAARTVCELRADHRAAVDAALVDVEPNDEAKKLGAAFSPVRYRPGETRSKAGVEAVSALVLDLDNVTPEDADAVFARLDGLCCWGWTTWGSGWKKHPAAWRIVVPLAANVEAALWPDVWQALVERFAPSADQSTKDASRLHFLPRAPRRVPGPDGELVENAPPLWREHAGALLDPFEAVEHARALNAQRAQARRDAEAARARVRVTPTTSAASSAYADAALAGECARIRSARRGVDWHPTLNKAGFAIGQLVGGGVLGEEYARRRLLEAASAVIVAGNRNYDAAEAERVIDNAIKAGKQEPRAHAPSTGRVAYWKRCARLWPVARGSK